MREQEEQLRNLVNEVLEFEIENLVSRPEWGAISFEHSRTDLERIFGHATHLSVLPIEELPLEVLNAARNAFSGALSVLKELSAFSIETGSPTNLRDELQTKVAQQAEQLTLAVSTWIPYLAYVRGDVETNIERLSAAVDQAKYSSP